MGAILITGASSGLGREIAIQLAPSGKKIYLLGLNETRLEEVTKLVREAGGIPEPYACDLTEFESIEKWYQNLTDQNIEIEALYICAGRNTFGEVVNLSMDDLEWVYRINLLSTAQWVSMVYPQMAKQGFGSIVIISSLSAFSGFSIATPYAATKRAMLALGHSIWPEADELGIKLQIACPGFVKTRIFEASRLRECQLDQVIEAIRKIGLPMIPARNAVSKLLKGSRQNKKLIIFPFSAKFLAMISFRAPWILDISHRRILKTLKKHRSTPPRLSRIRDYAGKCCVVTGAGSGIGKELVLKLLADGAKVYALDLREERLSELKTHSPKGADLKTIVADISQRADMEAAAETIHRETGQVDLLINNAGITLVKETVEVDFAEWKKILDTNYLGTLHGIHAFYPAMVKAKSGHIANVASIAGHSGYATSQAYATSKGAVIGFTRSLEVEAKNYGVRISCICPSYVDTNIFTDSSTKDWSVEKLRSTFLTSPLSSQQAARHTLEKLLLGKKLIVFPFSGRLLYWITSWSPWAIPILQKRLLKKYRAAQSSQE